MSGNETPDSKVGPIGPMYFYDLLDYLETRNATSHDAVLAHIELTRVYGLAVAGAVEIAKGIYEIRVHIGYGLVAVLELERDRNGRLQPVLGEVVKR